MLEKRGLQESGVALKVLHGLPAKVQAAKDAPSS
jgi:hypothetical protein